MTAFHDLPLFKSVPENTEYSFERSKQGANKTLTVTKYGLGFSISRETVDDGKFEWISKLTQKLAKSARETQEIQAMNLFNNGFASETAPDGLAIFHAAHTLPSGGTYSNLLTAADLSQTSLGSMLSQFEQNFVGDSGIITLTRPKFLVVHPDNKRYAMELVGSDGKPDTANNNLNAFKSDGLEVVSSPHLTDNDAWFLMAAPGEHNFDIVVRKPISTEASGPDMGFSTDSIYYKASYREVIGCGEPIGIMGSAGV